MLHLMVSLFSNLVFNSYYHNLVVLLNCLCCMYLNLLFNIICVIFICGCELIMFSILLLYSMYLAVLMILLHTFFIVLDLIQTLFLLIFSLSHNGVIFITKMCLYWWHTTVIWWHKYQFIKLVWMAYQWFWWHKYQFYSLVWMAYSCLVMVALVPVYYSCMDDIPLSSSGGISTSLVLLWMAYICLVVVV